MGSVESKKRNQLTDLILTGREGQIKNLLRDYPQIASMRLYNGVTTPLCRATFLGRRNVVALLLDAGAKIDETSAEGNTPLMWAAWKKHQNLVEYLVISGAALELENQKGMNALDLAIVRMNYKGAQFLREKGLKEKTLEFYKEKLYTPFDIELFIELLASGADVPDTGLFFEKLRREEAEWNRRDLVVDPRESWRNWFKR